MSPLPRPSYSLTVQRLPCLESKRDAFFRFFHTSPRSTRRDQHDFFRRAFDEARHKTCFHRNSRQAERSPNAVRKEIAFSSRCAGSQAELRQESLIFFGSFGPLERRVSKRSDFRSKPRREEPFPRRNIERNEPRPPLHGKQGLSGFRFPRPSNQQAPRLSLFTL